MIISSLLASKIYDHDGGKVPSKFSKIFLWTVILIELCLFIWAVFLAWKCGKRHQDLFIHILFAFVSPIIYILYYYLTQCGDFTGCGVQ